MSLNKKTIICISFAVIILMQAANVFSADLILDTQDDGQDTVIIYGDTRQSKGKVDQQKKIAGVIAKEKPLAFFHSGDLVDKGGSEKEWKQFGVFNAAILKTGKFYPARGNHDWDLKLWKENLDLPGNEQWYSIEIGNVHFTIIDCDDLKVNAKSEQWEWIEKDMSAIQDHIVFRFIVMHVPFYSTGYHSNDEYGLQSRLDPLFGKYGINAVFVGHDHIYERNVDPYGKIHIVTGGGGAPLYKSVKPLPEGVSNIKTVEDTYHYVKLSLSGSEIMNAEVIDAINGDIIDSFTIPGNAESVKIEPRVKTERSQVVKKVTFKELENGEFSNGLSGWDVYYGDKGEAKESVSKGEFKIVIKNGGDESWSVHLAQEGIAVEKNKTYRVTFDARVNSPRSINGIVCMGTAPYTTYSDSDEFELTKEMTSYSYEFTMQYDSDDDAKLEFDFGQDKHTVYMDNIKIEVIEK